MRALMGFLRWGLPMASSWVAGWSLGMEDWGPYVHLATHPPTPPSEDATRAYFPGPCMDICSTALDLSGSAPPNRHGGPIICSWGPLGTSLG